jgi:pterin-4a-carbinolamine dehydratase
LTSSKSSNSSPPHHRNKKPKIRRSLKVTEWNVRSINAQENKLALKLYLANHHPDILILVETWARVDINFETDGYLVHQTVLADHQGVAILVKEEYNIKKILSLGTRLLAVEVSSKDWTQSLTVVGSYHQATDDDICKTVNTFMSNARLQPILITGDYNHDQRRMDDSAKEWGLTRSTAKTRRNVRLDTIYANGDLNQETTFERGTSDHRILQVNITWRNFKIKFTNPNPKPNPNPMNQTQDTNLNPKQNRNSTQNST